MKKYLIGIITSATIVAGASASTWAVTAFTNGSFEVGPDPGSFTTLNSGDTSINGWTVSSGSVDYIGTYWQASDGDRSLDMSGNNAGAVSQSFSTVAGHTYTVKFDMAGNPDGAPTVKTLNVDTGGAATPYSFDTTGHDKTNMGWQTDTYKFTATSSSTSLTFTSADDTAFGPALDNVLVSVNPPTKESQCKHDGWKEYSDPSFKNQGKCLAYVDAHSHSISGNIEYTAYGLKRHAQFGMNTADNSGAFMYKDANKDWYQVNVSDVSAYGQFGWFAGKVVQASNHAWVGNWLFAKVQDNHPDQIWGSFVSESAAKTGVDTMGTPPDGPFAVTSGNLIVQ